MPIFVYFVDFFVYYIVNNNTFTSFIRINVFIIGGHMNILASTGTTVTTVDQQIASWFNNNFGLGGAETFSWGNLILCVLAIVLSVILCGLVGIEREMRGRSAGLRTHLLVGVGSAVIMIISIYGFPGSASDRDAARLAAQVVAGVGFLGAGAIIHAQGGIKGLTTASTIWLVMAIGLACGSMNFVLAITATIIVMIILISFRKIERIVTMHNPLVIVIADINVPVVSEILAVAKEFNCEISETRSQIIQNGNHSNIEFTFKITDINTKEFRLDEFIENVKARTNAVSIQILNHH